MRKLRIIFIMICLISVATFVKSSGEIINDENEYLVIKSSKLEEFDKLNFKGLDFKKYKLDKIYQYILLNSETLFILGISEAECMELLSINLKDGKATVIKKYPVYITWAADEAKFNIVLNKNNKFIPFVIVEYTQGNVARNIDQRESYVDILCPDNKNQYQLVGSERLSENNIAYVIMTETKYKYYYLAVDMSQRGPAIIMPARSESAKIQFSDCNWDGYPDILIWKTVSYSRLIEEKDKSDFPLHHEELFVMYFQPQEMKFSKPMPVDWN